MLNLKSYIREVPDFPKPGVSFKDIGPLLKSPVAFQQAIDGMAETILRVRGDASTIVAIESRGFVFGFPLALKTQMAAVMVRKEGKLPGPTIRADYALEYGSASLEMQKDSIRPGERVWIVDDVLASGGSAAAASRLVELCGGIVVGYSFLLELYYLYGRAKLVSQLTYALVFFDR